MKCSDGYTTGFMRLSAGQFTVRLICGLGLLLVPAVQEKVCARPTPIELKKPETPGPSDSSQSKSRRPLTLTAMLPDVVAPRWPNHSRLLAASRVRPLPVAAWGPRSAPDDDTRVDFTSMNAAFRAVNSRSPAKAGPLRNGAADFHAIRIRRLTRLSDISIAGPPRP